MHGETFAVRLHAIHRSLHTKAVATSRFISLPKPAFQLKKMVRKRTKRHHASWQGGKWKTRRAKTPTTSSPASLTNLIRVRDQDRGQPANLRCKIDADKSHSKWHRLTSARQSENWRSRYSLIDHNSTSATTIPTKQYATHTLVMGPA